MKLNKYFSREEFACKDGCGFDTVDVGLLELLTDIREHFKAPITLTSACRCEAHNKAIQGSSGSKHKLGIAADIQVKGVSPSDVYEYVTNKYPDQYGFGSYNTFTHVDVRSGSKGRW